MKNMFAFSKFPPSGTGAFSRNLLRIPAIISLVLLLIAVKGWGQTTVFADNFDRGAVVSPLSNGGTPTMTWTTTSTITPPGTSSTNLNSGTNYNAPDPK